LTGSLGADPGYNAAMRTLAVALVVGATAAGADAMTWRGETEQGRSVSVRAGPDDVVKRVRINWRAPCRNGRYVSRTLFRAPLDVAEAGRFEDRGTYRSRVPGGYRARHTVFVSGELGADDRWRGTFRVRTLVTRGGRVVDRCRLERLRWEAEPA
jgi:hypothetical protein